MMLGGHDRELVREEGDLHRQLVPILASRSSPLQVSWADMR